MPIQPTLRRSHSLRSGRAQRFPRRVHCLAVGQCFDIEVTRDAEGWMIRVPELGEVTRASRRTAVELVARRCIASRTGIPIGYVTVYVTHEGG
ncbi:hypothetical protein A5636_22215 [Mycobacterium asiaticum]|uniref:Long chain fatty acid-CoA synthetase Faa4p n=1 Tax=Mycobacterium asiaticum TaxID=1790 RepID=A0A1A3N817_MYCAS|nr:hypothetical protein A5636_22215 [Mycobacterium asiaticum]